MSDVIIKDNFLNSKDCDFFVKWFEKYYSILYSKFKNNHNGTDCIKFSRMLGEPDFTPNIFKKLFSDISIYIKEIDNDLFINYLEIVKWPEGQYQSLHKDFEWHPYTSILYLNDDYEGGQTKVGDQIIQPKKGTIISFKGKDISHQVLKVTKGNRYTVPVWYSTLLTFREEYSMIKV